MKRHELIVIGAGPGGLTAAYYLRRAGVSVTVYDEHEKAGGVLTYGIPHYRLPKTIVDSYVQALEKMGVNIDKVVEIHVPDEAITARMSGRRVCEGCGNSYHIQYKPTKVEGICDACGAKVVQRVDDKPETVISRLKTYHEKTAPLKDFYAAKGKLVTVEGQDEISETSKLTLAAIKG